MLPIRRSQHVTLVRDSLASWSETVAEAQGVAVPDSRGLNSTCGFLIRWQDHILARDFGKDYAEEILGLASRAWSLTYPSGVYRSKPLGPCIEQVPAEDGTQVRCEGTLSAVIQPHADLLPSMIACDTCGVEIAADGWLTYGRRIRAAA
jgi:hypothetical protein